MSCRIDRVVGPDKTALFITGTISGPHVETLRNVMREEPDARAIDLKCVSLVDREAVQLLALAEDRGIELRNCPAYIREWVSRERADMHAEKPNSGTGVGQDVDDV